MTIEEFFIELVPRTAEQYRDMIQGIADTHDTRGWISERQGTAVKTSAAKAGMELPDDLVIGDPRDSQYTDTSSNHVKSAIGASIHPGDLIEIRNGMVVGVFTPTHKETPCL